MPEWRLDLVDVLNQDVLSVINSPWNWTSVARCIPSYGVLVVLHLKQWNTYYHHCRCRSLLHKYGSQNRQLSMQCRHSDTSRPPHWTSSTKFLVQLATNAFDILKRRNKSHTGTQDNSSGELDGNITQGGSFKNCTNGIRLVEENCPTVVASSQCGLDGWSIVRRPSCNFAGCGYGSLNGKAQESKCPKNCRRHVENQCCSRQF